MDYSLYLQLGTIMVVVLVSVFLVYIGNRIRIRNRPLAHKYTETFVGIVFSVFVGFFLTGVGIYYNEKASRESIREIQEAMYPNEWAAELQIRQGENSTLKWQSGSGFNPPVTLISEDDIHCVPHKLYAKEKAIQLHIRIRNLSKYPANNLIGAFYLLEPTFQETAKRVKEEQGFKFFDARPMEVSPLEINPDTQAIKLEGFGFHIDRIEGKYGFQSFNTKWVDLTMNRNYSLVVMRIGNKFWNGVIVLEPEPGE